MSLATPRLRGADTPAPRTAVGKGLVLSVSLGTVLNPVNSSMLAVALVPIAHAFGVSVTTASWLVSALYITTAVAQPTWGRIVDAGAGRRVFLTGACLVAVAGAAAPFAPDIAFLIGVRVLLGLGTASAYPSALAIVRRVADESGGEVPTGALGAISFAAQVTNAFGPALGGLLVTVGGWKWVFLFNLPFVAVVIALALRYIPADRPIGGTVHVGDMGDMGDVGDVGDVGDMRDLGDMGADPAARGLDGLGPGRAGVRIRDLDPVGIALFAGATGLGVATLLNLEASAPLVLGLAFGSLLSGAGLVLWELRAPTPFIPLSLFQNNGGLAVSYARVAVFNTIFYAIYYGWPVWLERGRGLSPSTTGLITLPIAAVGAVSAMGAARLTRGRGPRLVLIIGAGVLTAGTAALLGLTPVTPIPLLIAVAMVLGVPNGFNSVGNQLATYSQAPASMAGVAAGLQRTSSYIGANIASALVGLTVAASGARGHSGALHVMAGILAAVSASLLLESITSRTLGDTRVRVDVA